MKCLNIFKILRDIFLLYLCFIFLIIILTYIYTNKVSIIITIIFPISIIYLYFRFFYKKNVPLIITINNDNIKIKNLIFNIKNIDGLYYYSTKANLIVYHMMIYYNNEKYDFHFIPFKVIKILKKDLNYKISRFKNYQDFIGYK